MRCAAAGVRLPVARHRGDCSANFEAHAERKAAMSKQGRQGLTIADSQTCPGQARANPQQQATYNLPT